MQALVANPFCPGARTTLSTHTISPSPPSVPDHALTTRSTARNNRQNVKQTARPPSPARPPARTHAPTHAPARRARGVQTNRRLSPTEKSWADRGADVCSAGQRETAFVGLGARINIDCVHGSRSEEFKKLGRGEARRGDVAFHGELEIDRCTSRGPRQGRRDSAVRDLLSLRVGSCCACASMRHQPCQYSSSANIAPEGGPAPRA
uniref:Uncharacterized protein n=1 Tax=Oryza punctata TaxID=4537 RepID=A0A0E0LMB3_ORYPU